VFDGPEAVFESQSGPLAELQQPLIRGGQSLISLDPGRRSMMTCTQ
jgi:hypothetical protein